MTSSRSICMAGLLVLAWVAEARADDLDAPEDIYGLCAYSSPIPDYPEPEEDSIVFARVRYNYVRERSERLLYPYRVTIEPQAFTLMDYDSEAEGIRINTYQPFAVDEGAFEVVLGKDEEIVFPCDPEEAENIIATHSMGGVSLTIVFNLVSLDNPELPYCKETPDPVVWQVQANILLAELMHMGNESLMSTYRSPRYEQKEVQFGKGRVLQAPPVHPGVIITRLETEHEEALTQTIDNFLRLEIEASLLPCYMKGLQENTKLQGAMSMKLTLNVEGELQGMAITIDTMNSEEITACALKALNAIRVPQMPPVSNDAILRLTVIFTLENQ